MSFLNSFRTLAALAAATAVGCAHQTAPAVEARTEAKSGQPHLAGGCLAVCQEATYVELSPKGDLCRCWAPNAFQYTFAFPDTKDKVDYSRSRWTSGMQNVRRCQSEGKAWEPSQERDQIVCLDPNTPQAPSGTDKSAADHLAPSGPDKSAADHSSPKLPESVF
jgi:hypothetical protein